MRLTTKSSQAAALLLATAALALNACSKANPSPVAPSVTAQAPAATALGSVIVSGQVTGVSFLNAGSSSAASALTVSVIGAALSGAVDNGGRFRLVGVPAGSLTLQFAGPSVSARVAVGQVAENEQINVVVALNGASGTVEASEHVRPDDGAEVEGRITSIDVSARTFAVGVSTVRLSAQTKITSKGVGLRFEDLQPQQRVHVEGTVQAGAIEAREVEVEDLVQAPQPQPPAPPDAPEAEVEFRGQVQSVGGSCPILTLTVAGRPVTTNGSTSFPSAPCSTIAQGTIVEVKGSMQAGGVVLASRVQLEDDGKQEPEPENEVEFGGTASLLGGSCPAISIRVAGFLVTTTASTSFEKGNCANVVTGVSVEVKGARQSDGSVNASRVKIESAR